jgi:predicted Zn-dependent protease
MRRLAPHLCALALAALSLAGCDTAEERAEAHYRRALELLAAGDAARAKVEFRNVFRLDGEHVAARLAYAAELRREGEIREAWGQYLRVVEQEPQSLEAHRALIALALQGQDFAAAAASVAAAYALAPGDPEIRAWKATLDYRDGKGAEAVAMAREVVGTNPELVAAQLVLIADRLAAGAPAEALALADAGLARAPADASLHLVRLRILEETGDRKGAGAELARMAEIFPEDAGMRRALVGWHLSEGDPDAAEAVLRQAAAANESGPALTLVQFLLELRGPEAARAELEARIAAAEGGDGEGRDGTGADPLPFRRALAGLDFAEGRSAEAIAALRSLTAGAPASDATRDLEITLAEMLAETGDAAGAGALVEGVLAADPAHVAALKLDAKLAIDADRPEDAVEDMRAALAQAPRDPEIMTIMALAHERQGSRELAGERLALAVEYSAQAPAESLRYARFLMQDGRSGPAEGVVADALRRAPEDPALLEMLGRIHLARRDFARAGQVAAILRAQATPDALAKATALEAASLEGQGRTGETIELLKAAAGDGGEGGGGGARALAALIEAYVAAGDLAAAEAHLDALLAREPQNVPGRLMLGSLDALRGDAAGAEAGYRAVIAENPGARAAYQALATLIAGRGEDEAALAALDQGLAALPGDEQLRFLKAGLLEARGDIDGAIGIYEALYAADSGSPVIANNLASLIAGNRADAASLERAYLIARRLRGSTVPEFQDTLGWILHRRGESAQALGVLAPAAEALPGNALVQFHLAEVALALGRREEARAAYGRALAAAAAGSPLPQAAEAQARVAAIDAGPPEAPPAPGDAPASASGG